MMSRTLAAFVAALALCAPGLLAQGLVHVTQGPAAVGPLAEDARNGRDLGFFSGAPDLGRLWFGRRSLDLVFGDRDGDGTLDDPLPDVDAICAAPAGSTGDVTGLLLSFDQNVTDLAGTTVLDGDVVTVGPLGAVTVVYPESFFATATGTGAIDVDALHVLADGSVLFSFAEDETTTDPALIAQNGGDPDLDETTVFCAPPGQPAYIVLDRASVLLLVNTALGTALSTVVDVTGITADPFHPGDLLLCFGSGNDAVEGRVLGTHLGGSVFQLGGQDVDSAALGFADLEVLQGLAWVDDAPGPALHHPAEVSTDPSTATFVVTGATPFTNVTLAATPSRLPAEDAVAVSGFSRPSHVHLDLTDPFLATQITLVPFQATSDAAGRAVWAFPAADIPPGLSLTLQAFEAATPAITPPIAVRS